MGHIRNVVIFIGFLAVVSATQVRQDQDEIQILEEYIASKKQEINPRYRLHYHVAGPVGWINDPNGFSHYKGQYHLFYQYYPYDSVWGPMHWGHTTSPDLVYWNQMPTALIPEEEQCFSGSAVTDGDTLTLMYTAHKVSENEPYYNQSQYLAFSNDGVTFEKYEGNPVLPTSPNGSPDFRDPKVWKHGDHWYVVIGSKTEDNRGRVLLYRSTDLKDWEFLSIIGESNGDSYMWECPDFFELDGKFILLMSPQGMEPVGDRYKNTHQTGYIIGKFNYETFEFVPEVDFQELDFGHDFYATQTTDLDGKRYVIAWFNMWEVPHPEEEDGWSGAMTLVRELRLVGDRLIMKPVDGIEKLREFPKKVGLFWPRQKIDFDKTAELIIYGNLRAKIELQIEGRNGGNKTSLRWEPRTKKVVVDRGFGDVRQVEWKPLGSKKWRLFLDASSLELFCGEGEVVFSSRVFPDGGWRITNLSKLPLRAIGFPLKRSVPE